MLQYPYCKSTTDNISSFFFRKPTNKIKKGDATESSSIYSVTGKYMDNEAYVRDDVMDSINHTASYNFTNL